MQREDIRDVLRAFLDPKHPAYPGDRRVWNAAPVEAVREVAAKLKLDWSEEQIAIVGQKLTHSSSQLTFGLIQNLTESENIINDTMIWIKPAYKSAIVMHNVTFYLGVMLILIATYTAYTGQEILGAILGGSGLGTVIVVFLHGPINGVRRSVRNLIQLELIYNSYTKQIGFWRPYAFAGNLTVNKVVIREILESTERTLCLIQEYCERVQGVRLPDRGGHGSSRPG
jgi:hypothetical protein